MQKPIVSDVEFQLRKLFIRYSDLFDYYQWPSEHSRWIELLFALVARLSKKPEEEVRNTIEELDELELLDTEILSDIPAVNNEVDLESTHAKRIYEILTESGFSKEKAKSTILVMHEAAKGLKTHHDGKIQKYLRKYGQRMIDELPENFNFSKMSKSDVEYVFSYWLQNVIDMAISLNDDNIKKFCKKFNKNSDELVKIVDKLDINLAIVDDMVQLYFDEEKAKKTISKGSSKRKI